MASTIQGHIQQLQGMLANPDFISRLPDGGEKLRVRLRRLLGEESGDSSAAMEKPSSSSSSSSQQPEGSDSIQKASSSSLASTAGQKRHAPIVLSPEVSLSAVMHNTFDQVLPRAELARLCGEEIPAAVVDQAATEDGDETNEHSSAAAAAAAASATETATSQQEKQQQHMPKKSTTALHIMTWDDTLKAQEELLEEERTAELLRIQRRMQMFLQ